MITTMHHRARDRRATLAQAMGGLSMAEFAERLRDAPTGADGLTPSDIAYIRGYPRTRSAARPVVPPAPPVPAPPPPRPEVVDVPWVRRRMPDAYSDDEVATMAALVQRLGALTPEVISAIPVATLIAGGVPVAAAYWLVAPESAVAMARRTRGPATEAWVRRRFGPVYSDDFVRAMHQRLVALGARTAAMVQLLPARDLATENSMFAPACFLTSRV